MGIRRRILLSLTTLFAVVLAAAVLVATVLVTQAVERRLEVQTENLAVLIDAQPRILDQQFLRHFETLYGAQSITVGPAGRAPSGPEVFRAPTRSGELVVAYNPDVISREKSEAVRPFAIMAAAGLGLVLVLGYVTAQTIARPLERLADQARSLPGGDVKAVGGGAELDHLVDALNRMLAEVRRTERLVVMGRMAAGVAHEIRNPLASMKMTMQMLRGQVADKEPCDLILREIERLELAATELMGGSQPLRKERASLARVADDVLDLMARQLDHLGIRVEKRYRPAPDVEIDVSRFKRCIMNLVLNGAREMPSGGPLTVEVSPREKGVRLAVTDAGGGVPAGIRDRIFEPFVTTKPDGVGLGLALTKQVVEEHGGRIGFDSGDRGATFWIDLPA